MDFNLKEATQVLERTPKVLESLLKGLSDNWLKRNEGENTWSPYEVLGHLIEGEKKDWIPRTRIILSHLEDRTFDTFDRYAHLEESSKTIEELLQEFKTLRENNLSELKSFALNEQAFSKKGVHPDFGEVDLKQLLATWVVHDLGHISQINRVMAKQYVNVVGPWINYLGILKH